MFRKPSLGDSLGRFVVMLVALLCDSLGGLPVGFFGRLARVILRVALSCSVLGALFMCFGVFTNESEQVMRLARSLPSDVRCLTSLMYVGSLEAPGRPRRGLPRFPRARAVARRR